MKKRLVLPGIFAASLAFATIASAQTPRQIIKQIDANGDRMLQFAEIQNSAPQSLIALTSTQTAFSGRVRLILRSDRP